jgi:hypothetical protein
MSTYINSTIEFLKNRQKQKVAETKLNNSTIGNKLYFVKVMFPPCTEVFNALIDTGASNSLIHSSIVERLKILIKPTQLRLATATGSSSTAITGSAHIKFQMETKDHVNISFCTQFIVSSMLNGLQLILGAEFLLDDTKVTSISTTALKIIFNDYKYLITLHKLNPKNSTDSSLECQNIHNDENQSSAPDNTIATNNVQLNMNHNIRHNMENKTLPPADEIFDDMPELKFEALEKKLSLEDADYSDCPPQYQAKLKTLLYEFEHRFSKSKLDLEITDLYNSDLPTKQGIKVQQKVRRLPYHKYEFTTAAINQLISAGVITKSDSTWKSNVVLVKKPSSSSELRDNSKASQ